MPAADTPLPLPYPPRTVTVTGPALPRLAGMPLLAFGRLSGGEAISELFNYSIELRPASRAARFGMDAGRLDAMIGSELTVRIELDGDGAREISGIVAAVEQTDAAAGETRYHVTLRPWLWLATRRSDCKGFQEQSVIDILDEVLARYPFPVDKRLDPAAYPKLAWQVQYNETDAHFIQRLTEEHGIAYFFEHRDGRHRLVLTDGPGAYCQYPAPAYNALRVRPRGAPAGEEFLTRFARVHRLRTGQVTLGDYDYRRPRADLTAIRRQPAETGFADLERYEYPGGHANEFDGERRVRLRIEERRARSRRVHGAGNMRGVAAGYAYEVVGHGDEIGRNARSRTYLVLRADLTLEDVGERSGTGQRYRCRVNFEAQPVREVYRPPLSAAKPRIAGVQRAVVTGPKDHEIWCNEFGAVRLQFEWDRYGQRDERSSPWIRTASGWAGDRFGDQHVPRIGQEVLVAYVHGDPNLPVIVGRSWNTHHLPPGPLPARQVVSGWRSKEVAGNRHNALWMVDAPGQIQTQLSSDHDVSQLGLGYLGGLPDERGVNEARGEGFELRTEGHGAIRGARGLLLIAEALRSAASGHLSREAFLGCLEAALETARALGENGEAHAGLAADTEVQAQLARAVQGWEAGTNTGKNLTGAGGQPLIGAYAPAGIAMVTPQGLTSYAGVHLDAIARQNQQLTAGRQFIVNAGTGISWFAQSGDVRTIAHRGDVLTQAQGGSITANAAADLTMTAAKEVLLHGGQSLTLMSGNAGIRIGNGCVEIFGPTCVHVHTPEFRTPGPKGLGGLMPGFASEMMHAEQAEQFVLTEHQSGLRLADQRYRIRLSDGRVIEGKTNEHGETGLAAGTAFDTAEVEILRNADPDSVIAVQRQILLTRADTQLPAPDMERRPTRRVGGKKVPIDAAEPTTLGKPARYATCEPYTFGMRLAEPDGKNGVAYRYPVAQAYTDRIQALLTWGIEWPKIAGKLPFANSRRMHLRGTAAQTGLTIAWPMNDESKGNLTKGIKGIAYAALQETAFGLPAGAVNESGAMPFLGYIGDDPNDDPNTYAIGKFTPKKWILKLNPSVIETICKAKTWSDRSSELRMLAATIYHEVRHCQQYFWVVAMMLQFPQDYPGLRSIASFWRDALPRGIYALTSSVAIPDEPSARIALKRLAISKYYRDMHEYLAAYKKLPMPPKMLIAEYEAELDACDPLMAELLQKVGRNGRPIDYRKLPELDGYRLRPSEDDAFACDLLVSRMWEGLALPQPDRCNAAYDIRDGERPDFSL